MTTTILLIEDDEHLRAAHGRFIRRTFPASYLIAAETASRAIAVLASIQVDMVVSDYDLGPGGGCGGDVLRWVRAHRPALTDRFVFLTGSGSEARREHHRVLEKGGPIRELGEYLHAVAGGSP